MGLKEEEKRKTQRSRCSHAKLIDHCCIRNGIEHWDSFLTFPYAPTFLYEHITCNGGICLSGWKQVIEVNEWPFSQMGFAIIVRHLIGAFLHIPSRLYKLVIRLIMIIAGFSTKIWWVWAPVSSTFTHCLVLDWL